MATERQVWFIPYFHCQLGRELVRKTLEKGYYVSTNCHAPDIQDIHNLELSYPETFFPVQMNPSDRGSCSGAVAEILNRWGHINIVVHCTSKVYCGAIEEMEDWQVAGQIESSFLNCTNVMEVMVPVFKRQKYGHFIAVTDINASSGGSGVGVLSGAQQAVESFCEGIALSLLSFNIRVTIVQTDAEVTLLTNPVVFSKPLPKYKSTLVDKTRDILASSTRFPTKAFDNTLSAITSIAGIKDPPGRLFVGENVIDQVKNKLTTFSEELDNYTD